MTSVSTVNNAFKPGFVQLAVDAAHPFPQEEVFSVAQEGLIRRWKQQQSGVLDSQVFTTGLKFRGVVAVHKDVYIGETVQDVLSGVDQHVVTRYGIEDKLASLPLLTFSLPVTSVAVSPDGQHLAAAAQDYVLKLLQLNGEGVYDRREFDGVVLNVTFDPESRFVAVSTSDGKITVLELKNLAGAETYSCVVGSSSNIIDTKCNPLRAVFHPIGGQLYIPSNKGILIVSTADWTQENVLRPNPDLDEEFSMLAISEGGRYLAACSVEGNVYVYHLAGNLLLSTTTMPNPSCRVLSMMFSPFADDSNEELLLADEAGNLRTIAGCAKLQLSAPLQKPKSRAIIVSDDEEEDMDLDTVLNKLAEDKEVVDVDNDEEDDDDIGRIKNRYGFDLANRPTAPTGPVKLPPEVLQALEKVKIPVCTVEKMAPPEPFVPNSADGKQGERYLKWNSFGQIKAMEGDSAADGYVQVSFNDVSVHAETTFEGNFELADFNHKLVALASETELFVYVLNSFDTESKRWSVRMPEEEAIENLAVGEDFVVVVTRERHVRIFTICGTQRLVFCIEGPIVSMAAQKKSLVLAVATGSVFVHSEDNYEHQLRADVFEVNAVAGAPNVIVRTQQVPLALSPGASLKWLAFSSSGQVATMDSEFVVRWLNPTGLWIPIFSGVSVTKNDNDDFWPLAVLDSESHFQEPKVRYVVRKSASAKLSAPVTIKWELPVCEKGTDKAKNETDIMIIEMLLAAGIHEGRDQTLQLGKAHLTTLLKLFGKAVGERRENRALELAEITLAESGVKMMAQYAAKVSSKRLVEKIAGVGQSRAYGDSLRRAKASESDLSRRLSLKRRVPTTQSQVDVLDELCAPVAHPKRAMLTDSADPLNDTQASDVSINTSLDFSSVNSPAVRPNPFKKSNDLSSQSSVSSDLFNVMATSASRSSLAPATSKLKPKSTGLRSTQAKLAFGKSSQPAENKENTQEKEKSQAVLPTTTTMFDVWRRDNESELRKEFDGSEKEFTTFLQRRFRTLDKAEKEKYKRLAAEECAQTIE